MSVSFSESAHGSPQNPSVLAVLLQIHRGKQTGLLRVMHGADLLRVWFESGAICHADGFTDIFSDHVLGDPPGGFSGDLMKDMGQAIALGVAPQTALRVAHHGIVDFIVRIGLSGALSWGFQEGQAAPLGAMPMPSLFLKEVFTCLENQLDAKTIEAFFAGKKEGRLVVLDELLAGDGFPPLTLRVFRLAAKGLSLQAVLDSFGSVDKGRELVAMRCVALLFKLGLVELEPVRKEAESPGRRESDVTDDLPFGDEETEETAFADEETEEISMSFRGGSLSERRRARGARRRTSGRNPFSSGDESSSGGEFSSEDESSSGDEQKLRSPAPNVTIPDDPKWFRDKAVELAGMNPLMALGLDPGESQKTVLLDTVRASFRGLASLYHPDRLNGYSEESKEAAEIVFSALSTVRDQLDTQATIDFIVKELQRERSGVKEVTEFEREKARVCGRKAEALMRHRKWKPAQALLNEALAHDPENHLMTLRAHFCSGLLKKVPYSEAAKAIEGVNVDGKKGRTERVYRMAWLWRLAGNEDKALSYFKDTLTLEPGHLEAQRGQRMMEKRVGEKTGKPERGLPFARFFKKK